MEQHTNEIISNLLNKLGIIIIDKILPYASKESFAKGVSCITTGIMVFIISIISIIFIIKKKDNTYDDFDKMMRIGAIVMLSCLLIGSMDICKQGIIRVMAPEATGVQDVISMIKDNLKYITKSIKIFI